MGNVNSLLSKRLNKTKPSTKTAALAKQSTTGNLSGFSGIFNVTELSLHEKNMLEGILLEYGEEDSSISGDLDSLISITAEVKAINNQAALLHGERIKKAKEVLKEYRDGAFTSWLIATYGNRQTPYNFLQYYEFYDAAPNDLRPQIEAMPRQAIYTLASRDGCVNQKHEIVQKYQGQTKAELLQLIRDLFPLGEEDKRKQNLGEATIVHLRRACSSLAGSRMTLNKTQRHTIDELIDALQSLLYPN